MSQLLASVNSLSEALLVADIGVDIIDLKQPVHGALGALTVTEVGEIVRTLQGRYPISATVGDLPATALPLSRISIVISLEAADFK